MKRPVLFLCLGIILTACSHWNQDDDDQYAVFKGVPAKQLYTEAKTSSKQSNMSALQNA